MYTRIGKQRPANTLYDYSSGSGATFGIDRNLVTTAETLQQFQDENPGKPKSQPSSHKKKKLNGQLHYQAPSSKQTIK